jgi:hypothetical protein
LQAVRTLYVQLASADGIHNQNNSRFLLVLQTLSAEASCTAAFRQLERLQGFQVLKSPGGLEPLTVISPAGVFTL